MDGGTSNNPMSDWWKWIISELSLLVTCLC